jgi:hypothetical protein
MTLRSFARTWTRSYQPLDFGLTTKYGDAMRGETMPAWSSLILGAAGSSSSGRLTHQLTRVRERGRTLFLANHLLIRNEPGLGSIERPQPRHHTTYIRVSTRCADSRSMPMRRNFAQPLQ